MIGGYGPGAHGLDSIIVGYYRGKELLYIALVRNGFVRRKDTIVPNVLSCTKIVR